MEKQLDREARKAIFQKLKDVIKKFDEKHIGVESIKRYYNSRNNLNNLLKDIKFIEMDKFDSKLEYRNYVKEILSEVLEDLKAHKKDNVKESMITNFYEFVNERFQNLKSYMENYDQYLSKLTHNYGNKEEAKEVLDWYIDVLKDIEENGGEVYRIVYLANKKELNTDELGISWTLNKDAISRFIGNIEVDEEGLKPYLVTGQIKPGKVDFNNSLSAFSEIPDEEEINFLGDPDIVDIKRWKNEK